MPPRHPGTESGKNICKRRRTNGIDAADPSLFGERPYRAGEFLALDDFMCTEAFGVIGFFRGLSMPLPGSRVWRGPHRYRADTARRTCYHHRAVGGLQAVPLEAPHGQHAVYPAVPIAMASRVLMLLGRGVSHLP